MDAELVIGTSSCITKRHIRFAYAACRGILGDAWIIRFLLTDQSEK